MIEHCPYHLKYFGGKKEIIICKFKKKIRHIFLPSVPFSRSPELEVEEEDIAERSVEVIVALAAGPG